MGVWEQILNRPVWLFGSCPRHNQTRDDISTHWRGTLYMAVVAVPVVLVVLVEEVAVSVETAVEAVVEAVVAQFLQYNVIGVGRYLQYNVMEGAKSNKVDPHMKYDKLRSRSSRA